MQKEFILCTSFSGSSNKLHLICSQVETIGDAYMIVGGAPVKNQFHAEHVADCALSVVSSTMTMVEQTSKKPIRIRAGNKNTYSKSFFFYVNIF